MTKPYSPDRGAVHEEEYAKERLRDLDQLRLGADPRAMAVLAALGLKPATEVTVYKHNDSLKTVERALQKAGLKFSPRPPDSRLGQATRLIVSQKPEIISEMAIIDPRRRSDARRYGELMGYLPSMIDAYEKRIERLPREEYPEDIRIFGLILSRANKNDEFELLRKWRTALEHYAPETLKQLIGGVKKAGEL